MSALEEKSVFVVTTNSSSQTLLPAFAFYLTFMGVVFVFSSSMESK